MAALYYYCIVIAVSPMLPWIKIRAGAVVLVLGTVNDVPGFASWQFRCAFQNSPTTERAHLQRSKIWGCKC